MDQDSAFMSSLMNYLFKKLYIKIKMAAPYNQAEHGINSLSNNSNETFDKSRSDVANIFIIHYFHIQHI